MIVKDISFSSAKENIFYDEALLEAAEGGLSGEVLRFWEAKEFFIVLGKISKPEDDIKVEDAKRDSVEIVRRSSGGGTVLQGPGCLNFSLILSFEKRPLLKNIRRSYEIILGGIYAAFKRVGVDAAFEPISDMVIGGRKFSGSAQARKRRYMLHHGTILYGFPIGIVEKYLAMPGREPPYRKMRSHADFLVNINADADKIKQAITTVFVGVEKEEWAGYSG